MNGQPWTRAEIDELIRTVTQGGNTLALSVRLHRTHDALIAKAKRLCVSLDAASLPTLAARSSGAPPALPAQAFAQQA